MPYTSFEFSFPTRIVFGPGESEKADDYAASFNPGKILLMTSAHIRPVTGKLMADLAEKKIPFVHFDGCRPNPKEGEVNEAAEMARREGCDLILAVGGGSVIDAAKATALAAANPSEGGIWDYVGTGRPPEKKVLPLMLVVTIASTGSEGNESFVLTDEAGTQKLIYSDPSLRPVLSVCDPELTVTLSARQTALGAADILSHLLEQYLHADTNRDASDEMTFALIRTVTKWAPIAVAKPEDRDARSNLLWCAILAMSRVLGVGHDENWLSHLIEHAVSAKYDIPHAAGMAAIFPAYLSFLEEKGVIPDKLARLADLWQAESAAEGLEKFEKQLGLPVRLQESLGFTLTEEVIKELTAFALPWGPMDAGGLGLFGPDDAERVLRLAQR